MYEIDYNDDRFKKVEEQQANAIGEAESTYGGMIEENDKKYGELINNVNSAAEEQKKLQQQQTDLAIEQLDIGQKKQEKQFENEQKSAYVDYVQKSANNHTQNQYNHLSRTGYDSSSDREIYSSYQNRLSVAYQAITDARTNYDLAKKDAILQNSSALLKIAQEAAQKALELGLQQFQYKNTLITELFNKKQAINSEYYGRYQDVLSQINSENEMKEKIRQYEEQMAYQKERDRIADEQWQKSYDLSKQSASAQNAYYQAMINDSVVKNPEAQGGTLLKDIKYGNSAEIISLANQPYIKKENQYFFSNGYQPRYIYDRKLKESGMTAASIGMNEYGNKNIWQGVDANGNTAYYLWASKDTGYIDVTSKVK